MLLHKNEMLSAPVVMFRYGDQHLSFLKMLKNSCEREGSELEVIFLRIELHLKNKVLCVKSTLDEERDQAQILLFVV